MDSSAIVCMADSITKQRPDNFSRLDTISYYNDHEPNWNERPYFTEVEETRGRKGRHTTPEPRAALVLTTKIPNSS